MPAKAAPVAIPKAPVPEALNKFGGTQRYIENLYVPGNRDYQAQYGGGGWVATRGKPGVDAISDQELRNYNKAFAQVDKEQGLTAAQRYDYLPEEIARLSAQYDARQAANTSSSTSTNTTRKMNDIKSIKGGLKIGANNILGAQEARKIARATGRTQDQVIAKALGAGFGIGGNLVNQSNKAFRPSMNPLAVDPLAAMRGVQAGRGQTYSGSYQLDGQTMPIVQARGGRANPLGMGAGGMGNGRRGRRGADMGGGAADMGGGAATQAQSMDTMPMTPQEMAAASSDININMPGVGEELANWATGFKAKRSRRRMAGRQAQGLASQRINPLGAWRFRA